MLAMADLSLEQIAALIDEKLRPIHAKLDEQARRAEQSAERHELRVGVPLAVVSLLVVIVAVLLAGRALLARLDNGGGPSSKPIAGRVLYADDFSSPAKGMFLDHQQGNARLPGDNASARWDYGYANGELVAHVSPPSVPLAGRVIGGAARALNRVTGDFAVEVRARAASPAANAVYGIRFWPGPREFAFGIEPSQKRYMLWEIFRPALLAAASPAVAPDGADNLLRLEARGSGVRLFADGQLLDSFQDDALGVRPAEVGLFFDSVAPPAGDSVEVRYTAFRVFSLAAS